MTPELSIKSKPKESWTVLGIDPDTKTVTILGGIGTAETELAAKQMGVVEAEKLKLDPVNNLVLDLTKPATVVKPLMVSWMHKHNIPEYQAVDMIKEIAKTIHERMMANKPRPVKW